MTEMDRDLAIESWTQGQIACRARGKHKRTRRNVEMHVSGASAYYLVVEVCSNCRSLFARPMSLDGFWLDRWKPLKYSNGYLLPKGGGRLTDEEAAPLRLAEYIHKSTIVTVDDSETGEEAS